MTGRAGLALALALLLCGWPMVHAAPMQLECHKGKIWDSLFAPSMTDCQKMVAVMNKKCAQCRAMLWPCRVHAVPCMARRAMPCANNPWTPTKTTAAVALALARAPRQRPMTSLTALIRWPVCSRRLHASTARPRDPATASAAHALTHGNWSAPNTRAGAQARHVDEPGLQQLLLSPQEPGRRGCGERHLRHRWAERRELVRDCGLVSVRDARVGYTRGGQRLPQLLK